jgi:PAS domain S-box-containing protein
MLHAGRIDDALVSAFEDSGVGTALVSLDGVCLRANRALAWLLGSDPETLAGARCPITRGEGEYERKIVRSDGSTVWLLVIASAARDEEGLPRHLVVHAHDITARKQAEAALDASRARYRALVEHLPMAIFSWAVQGDEVVYVSPQIEAIFGYPAEDWVGGSALFERLLHPDDRERVLAAFRHSAATGAPVDQEFQMRSRGRVLTIGAHATVVLDDAGRPLYMQGFLQDISEQRRLEEQLRLAQKLESIGQLAAGIAHEINTPVQFIGNTVGFVQGAAEDLLALVDAQDAVVAGDADADALARLDEAREIADVEYLRERLPAAFDRTADGIRRVADIVRAMRDFAHPPTADKAPQDLNAALRNTLVVATSEYKYVAELETDFGDLPPVVCNGGDINQVFLNLIVNAAHAIEESSPGNEARGAIRIRTRGEGDHVLISIADTGCGIPADVADRVFDPFFTTKEVGRGTGQGLAIARTLVVERHGGTLTFETVSGEGTTFHIRLPIDGRRLPTQVTA